MIKGKSFAVRGESGHFDVRLVTIDPLAPFDDKASVRGVEAFENDGGSWWNGKLVSQGDGNVVGQGDTKKGLFEKAFEAREAYYFWVENDRRSVPYSLKVACRDWMVKDLKGKDMKVIVVVKVADSFVNIRGEKGRRKMVFVLLNEIIVQSTKAFASL